MIILLMFILGIYLVMYGYLRCENNDSKIEYRFVPRTLKESWKDPVNVVDMYYDIFQHRSIIS